MKKVSSYLTLILEIILFSIMFIGSFFYKHSKQYDSNILITLLITLFIVSILFFLYKKYVYKKDKITLKSELLILSIISIILVIVEVFCYRNFNVEPSWDYKTLFDMARNFVDNGKMYSVKYGTYIDYYPNNTLLFYIYVILFKFAKLFKLSYFFIVKLFNIILINISYLFIYLLLRKKSNNRVAIYGLCISLLFIAPLFYLTVFYSDTFSMFVPILLIYLFSFINNDKVICKNNFIVFFIIALVLFYGYEIKLISIFPFIALFIYYIFNNIKMIINIFYSLLLFVIFIVIFKIIVLFNPIYEYKENNYGSIPYSHWIMMGVEDKDKERNIKSHCAVGSFDMDDFIFTTSFENGKDAIKPNLLEYKNRVKKLGVIGYPKYLIKKSVNGWTDGLYFSMYIQFFQFSKKSIRRFIFIDHKEYIVYYTQGIQYIFILSFIIGAIIKLRNKEEKIDIVRLSIIGLFIFLLFWENRSRYLLNYIPLFSLIIIEFINMISNIKSK